VTVTVGDILLGLLEAAVRLQIMRLTEMDPATFRTTWDAWTNDAYIASSGLWDEDILFGGLEGNTARAFNTFAKAIASLAFVPGGVTFFNQHYEATRHDLQALSQPQSTQRDSHFDDCPTRDRRQL